MSNYGLTTNSLSGAPSRITQAIATASRRTGVDFGYLMGQAQIESAMDPQARARTSSASGLYQFIDQSWLAVVNDHGAKYGMSWASDAIQKSGGRYYVADAGLREQILSLRNHPETASVMAAELASDNRNYIEQQTGRPAEAVDLYLAHFLGAGGAAKFLQTMNYAPNAPAASLFPAAARANASIFYDGQGNARSLAEIRDRFASKLANGAQTAGLSASRADMGGVGAIPEGANMVAPADYMRIARAQIGMRDMPVDDETLSGEDALATQQMLAETRPYPDAAPRAETARLAYLMLATLGR
ncbi:MAG: lytic transglycosylase domain-containing protein [Sphingomonadales bacterium]|nr:lytic transglycosylase domain-containing protein [Sphingomonadales bacterium]